MLVLEDGVPDQMALFGHPIAEAYPSQYLARADVVPGGDSLAQRKRLALKGKALTPSPCALRSPGGAFAR